MSQFESMNQRTGGPDKRSARHALAWLAYIAFVVYGSLVPLDFHPLPVDQAWATFRQLPMLQLGIESRADWVANGVLYFPVGFLTVTLFGQRRTLLARWLVPLGAMLFCFALALTVEYTQLFFAPRTVSLNDVIAEFIGSVLGIAAACYWSDGFGKLLAALAGRMGHLATHVVQFYALAYLAFSLFPFDFVLSRAELAAKMNSDSWGWFLAGDGTERGLIILAAKLLAELLAVMPIGLMLGRSNAARQLPATRHALLYGMLLGLLIEAAQFLVFSGVSQGASLLTRAAGMYGGARLWSERVRLLDLNLHPASKGLFLPLALLYLLALLAVNGWFDHAWQGMELAGLTLDETRWLPFYYHYYTTEQAALLSLVSVALMYAPIGVLVWLRRWSPAIALWCAALAATGIETSKLFLAGLHPDPTNVLIAAVATWSVTWLLQRLQVASTRIPGVDTGDATGIGEATSETRRGLPNIASAAAASHDSPSTRTWFALAASVALAAWIVIDFPYRPLLLALALLVYALALWFNPRLLWAAIPAAIPLLDLAPWSGRFFLDEFDYLIIVSLLVAYARVPPGPRESYRDVLGLTVACLVATTFAIGTLRGLLPLTLPDANAFSNYYSPYNALRLVKGALWALLLIVLMHRFTAGGVDIRGSFARGMVFGLAGTVVVVIWERLVFPGLFNFTDSYRVTGPFSQMHTGGADIETYLTAALPFAVLLTLQSRSLAARLSGGLLLLASSYALAVTFSRVGYAGFAVALIIVCLAAFLQRKPTTPASVRADTAPSAGLQPVSPLGMAGTRTFRWAAPLVLTVLVGAVVLPIFSGSFARERLATSAEDLAARQSHWVDALSMRSPGLLTSLFGMGIGRFPVTHYWGSSEARATSYQVHSEAGNRFLQLGTGQPLYLEQFVGIEPGEYLVHLDTRSDRAGGQLTVSLCEKLLLTSGRCVAATATQQEQDWQQHELRLSSGDIGSGTWLARPPVKLSLYNTSGTRIDIDNIRLLSADGEQVIGNGDFAQGLDLWFFTVDQDLPWHVWSLPVALLFDQGWYGLAAIGALLALAIKRTASQALQGDLLAGATLASLSGVLVIATLDTVIDTPRFLMLFLLLTCVGWSGKSVRQR